MGKRPLIAALTPSSSPSYWYRVLSRIVAAYPFQRGQTRLRRITCRWLVGHLPFGAWVRVSGLVDAEWSFLLSHVKEDATTEFIKSFLRPGMIFVDVGANVGYFTLLAASLGASVIAYEPTPGVFERLRQNVALNNFTRVVLVNAAVADQPGTLTLYQSPDDPEANNIFGEGSHAVEVPSVTLDEDLTNRGVQKIDLLKIDAEGAEPLVLAGATTLFLLSPAPTIIIEVNPVALRSANSAPAAVFNRLQTSGYHCGELERCMYKGEIVINILATPAV
jgi:FkbM family methyltransferase